MSDVGESAASEPRRPTTDEPARPTGDEPAPTTKERVLGETPPLKDLAKARSEAESARRKKDEEDLSESARRKREEGFNELADRYEEHRRLFENEHGAIVDEYWAEHSAMAAVLTGVPRRRVLRVLGLSPRYFLYRSTEGADLPYELEAALADGDTLAKKASLVLNGGAAATVLNRIFEAHKFLLSAVDSEIGVTTEWAHTIRNALREEPKPKPADEPSSTTTAP